MKKIIVTIAAIFSSFLGVFFLGKKYAKKELEISQKEDLLNKKEKQNEVKKRIASINNDKLFKLVQKWVRK